MRPFSSFFLIVVIGFSSSVFAYDPCRDMQILWQLDNNSQPIPPVTIANGSTANYFDISLPGLAPTSPGTASWVQRFNVPYNVPNISGGFGKKNLTTWIALPDSDTYVSLGNGLKGKIEILTGNYTKRGVYSGSAIYSGPYQYLEWTNGNFPSAVQKGTQYPLVQNYFTDTKLRVHIDKGSAFAGVYNISIPIKIGSEEWYRGEKTCSGGTGVEQAVGDMENRFSPVQVTVVASCSLNEKNGIAINHGAITSAQARAGDVADTSLSINCLTPSNVKLNISVVQPVPGEDSNVTQCGKNGKCTLTIDDQRSFSGSVDGVKNFKISSRFQTINASQPNAGAFTGNAIITVLMQ
ncbi:hypothetical protein NUKP32_52730 [Klebsiella variicola]|uniref:hypothetical protein n=1 Tax=Klebsiella variicola TaxID=244366 RepID=UPI0009BAB93C|nr:hypothetical protein [Klebsiella variicola]HCB0793761.1 hypothetical protein [Klebsiella variicola subsp. variicola]MBZ6721053.1 hypothetical protein [Klebsiella variicola]MDU5052797.1 hypothetical protein [Klebsiella variicola]UVW55699.1 hypothetical protein NYO12_29135 [Klebsiella variicola]SLV33250.1 Uncharacterised protein [Klebsiella variicola]